MLTTILTNLTIKRLEDKNFNIYYLIINNENQDEAYFCFERTVKEGWTDLIDNWENIKEVEVEYTEQERGFNTYRTVTNLRIIGEKN